MLRFRTGETEKPGPKRALDKEPFKPDSGTEYE
jgi:hypothetical protein